MYICYVWLGGESKIVICIMFGQMLIINMCIMFGQVTSINANYSDSGLFGLYAIAPHTEIEKVRIDTSGRVIGLTLVVPFATCTVWTC